MLFRQIVKFAFYLNSYFDLTDHFGEFIFFHCFEISSLILIFLSSFFIFKALINAFNFILSLKGTLFIFHFQINFQMQFWINYFIFNMHLEGQILI